MYTDQNRTVDPQMTEKIRLDGYLDEFYKHDHATHPIISEWIDKLYRNIYKPRGSDLFLVCYYNSG